MFALTGTAPTFYFVPANVKLSDEMMKWWWNDETGIPGHIRFLNGCDKKLGELTGWEVQESLKKQTIQVYGGLKIKQKTMYLQLYMKLKAANENPKQDHYYFCKVNLGPCSRKYLVTGHLIRFEVTLQDLRFEFEIEQRKPCKNLRI